MGGVTSRRAAITAMGRLGFVIATRPRLWGPALGAARTHVPAGWWRRAPFLPLPDRGWLRYRIITAYGGDGSTPIDIDDVITWLTWRHHFPR